jgi:hypothetical protein
MKKLAAIILIFITSSIAIAGPPYDTDDPQPVAFRGWEFYLSSHSNYMRSYAQGTLPHFEVNYGVVKNVQLHLLVPLAFNSEYNGKMNYGIGDIEVGVKFRFVQETKYLPQIGIFPLCELPSGNSSRELGNGNAQYFIPVWIQKSFGDKWLTYGGYGYWINSGNNHENWSYLGWQVQYQLTEKVSIGAEIYDIIPDNHSGNDVRFNIGSVIDLNSQNHLLLSAGRSFNNDTSFQCYVGYLFTISSDNKTFSKQF